MWAPDLSAPGSVTQCTSFTHSRCQHTLRAGANLHAAVAPRAVTPLSIARVLRGARRAPPGSAADLVLQASRPWEPMNHALFPAAARKLAVELLRLGLLMALDPRCSAGPAAAGLWPDLWLMNVMPLLVTR